MKMRGLETCGVMSLPTTIKVQPYVTVLFRRFCIFLGLCVSNSAYQAPSFQKKLVIAALPL